MTQVGTDKITRAEVRSLRDLSPHSVEVGSSRLARLAIRWPGHAPLCLGSKPHS
jgi:hypothetical protein